MSGYFPFTLTNGLMSPVAPTAPNRQDLIDYAGSGVIQSARYINPQTQDFQLNESNGQFLGQNAVDQSVLLALQTTFNSSNVNGLGNNFGSIKLIGQNITSQMNNALNQCLGSLIASGNIVLGTVTVTQTGQNQMNISFNYYNQSTGSNVPLNMSMNNGVWNV